MKKKLVISLVSLVSMLALTGCKKSGTSTTTSTKPSVTESTTASESVSPESIKIIPVATAIAVTGDAEVQAVRTGSVANTAKYTAVATPADAVQEFTWSVVSENGGATEAATISDAGVLTPAFDVMTDTKVKVIATSADANTTVKGEKIVTIKAAPAILVESLTISSVDDVHTIDMDDENAGLQLSIAVTPENADVKDVEWASSNTAVATVDADGKVTPVLDGACTITATAKDGSGKSATFEITVTRDITTVEEIRKAESETGTYTVKGILLAKTTITQQTDGEDVDNHSAILMDATGTFVVGTTGADLFADYGNGDYVEFTGAFSKEGGMVSSIDGSAVVVAAATNDAPDAPAAVNLADAAAFGGEFGEDGLFAVGRKVTVDSALAQVETDRVFTASTLDTKGNMMIALKDDSLEALPEDGIYGTFEVVEADLDGHVMMTIVTGFTPKEERPVATEITLDKEAMTVSAGETDTLTPTVTPYFASDLVWETTDSAVATVKDGVVTGLAEGVVTITARAAEGSDVKAECTVTVHDFGSVEAPLSVAGTITLANKLVAPGVTSEKFFTFKGKVVDAPVKDSGTGKYLIKVADTTDAEKVLEVPSASYAEAVTLVDQNDLVTVSAKIADASGSLKGEEATVEAVELGRSAITVVHDDTVTTSNFDETYVNTDIINFDVTPADGYFILSIDANGVSATELVGGGYSVSIHGNTIITIVTAQYADDFAKDYTIPASSIGGMNGDGNQHTGTAGFFTFSTPNGGIVDDYLLIRNGNTFSVTLKSQIALHNAITKVVMNVEVDGQTVEDAGKYVLFEDDATKYSYEGNVGTWADAAGADTISFRANEKIRITSFVITVTAKK
jgi:uncharacterized protein YjdB